MNRTAQHLTELSTLLRLEAQDVTAGRPLNTERILTIRELFDLTVHQTVAAQPATATAAQDIPAAAQGISAAAQGIPATAQGAQELTARAGRTRRLPFGMLGPFSAAQATTNSAAPAAAQGAVTATDAADDVTPPPSGPAASQDGVTSRELIARLALLTPGTQLNVRHPDWTRPVVTAGYTYPDGTLNFEDDPDALPTVVNVTFHETRRNVTVIARQEGWVHLGPDRLPSLPERLRSFRHRSFTVLLDGQVLTPVVPYLLENGVEGELHLPPLRPEPAPAPDALGDTELRIHTLKARRKVLRVVTPEQADRWDVDFTPEERAWLKDRHVSGRGWTPRTLAREAAFSSDVTELHVKLPGLASGLPPVADVHDRLLRGVNPTTAGRLIAQALHEVADLSGRSVQDERLLEPPSDPLIAAALADALEETVAELAALCTERAALMIAYLSGDAPADAPLRARPGSVVTQQVSAPVQKPGASMQA